MAANIEDVEILAGENIPVAIEKCATQMFGQRFQRAMVFRVVRVNRIVFEIGADEIEVARVIQLRAIESRRRDVIDPQRFHPCVTNVAGVGGAGHARTAALDRTTIA